jgi:hypothetical protein
MNPNFQEYLEQTSEVIKENKIPDSEKRRDFKYLKEQLNNVMNLLSKYKGNDNDLDNDISKFNSQAFSIISYTKFWNSKD